MAKRQELSLQEKIEVLDKVKKQPPNSSQRELAGIFEIPRSTLIRLINMEEDLRSRWCEVLLSWSQASKEVLKCLPKGKASEVDTALNQWFGTVTSKGQKLGGPILKEKAEDLAKKLRHTNFVATEGWLSRWKARHQIRYKRAHGEKGSADISAEEWTSTILPGLLEEYRPNEVYNADETVLYYRATPDGSLCYCHEKLSGFKKAMERITVLCCLNLTGYRANKKAWMTSQIFTEWFAAWDSYFTKIRYDPFLVDNCTAYPHVSTLKNIQLEFLPPNTTSLIQPMDQGIIKNLKTLYRKELVHMTLAYIEENILNPSSTAIDVSSKISILQAVSFVAKSWQAVKEATIINCFSKAGFFTLSPCVIDENDEELSLPEINNGEEYNNIDAELPCYSETNVPDDEIVETMIAKRPCLEQSDNDDNDEVDPVPLIMHAEAKLQILGLQRYFTEQGSDHAAHSLLDKCADLVHLRGATAIKQTTLLNYMN